MSNRLTIIAEIKQVAAEQKKTLAPLVDDMPLLESGLDSLCFANLFDSRCNRSCSNLIRALAMSHL